MNTSFTFPRHAAPISRSTPTTLSPTSPTVSTHNRKSNALRASVLDAALQLGIGQNSIVANWMFNDPLEEDDEPDERSSSAITYGSTATSDDSLFSGRPSTSSSSLSSNAISNPMPPNLLGVPEGVDFNTSINKMPQRPSAGINPFPEIPIPPRPVTPVSRGKLRKKRAEGYESDGGYVSDAGKRKGKKKSKGMVDEGGLTEKERAKEAKNRAKEEKLQEKKEKEEERKRKKSMSKKKKNQDDEKDGYTTGYETDGGKLSKKSKSKSGGDPGYDTDSGYVSSTPGKKSKTRFFRLGSKQSKVDMSQEDIPAMPNAAASRDPIQLPIASRFATTMSHSQAASNDPVKTSTDRPRVPLSMTMPAATSIPSLNSPTSPVSFTHDQRKSYSSGGFRRSTSQSSKSSKRQGIQSSSQEIEDENTTQSFVISPSQMPLPASTVVSPASSSQVFPAISLPLTHTLSTPGSATSRNPSPIPGGSYAQFLQAASLSPMTSATSSPNNRQHFPPIDGFGPTSSPPTRSSSPNPQSLSANARYHHAHHKSQNSSSLSIIPSSDYIVPSPRVSPVPNPSVIAYYEIQPSSPPPVGQISRAPSRSPSKTRDRAGGSSIGSIPRSHTPDQGLFSQPIPSIQRGREAPFPARPILPSSRNSIGPGLEARVKVPRYRELYGLTLPQREERFPHAHEPASHHQESQGDIEVLGPSDDEWDGEYDDEVEEDMRDVLNRFVEHTPVDERWSHEHALGRSRSIEALRHRISVRGTDSEYDEETQDAARQSSIEGGDRSSRWTESIYSRASVLDPDLSGVTRQRFLQRIEDMYASNGRERVTPPVPNVPETSLVGADVPGGRRWRF